MAPFAKFLQFHAIGVVTLIFIRDVIARLAISALKGNDDPVSFFSHGKNSIVDERNINEMRGIAV